MFVKSFSFCLVTAVAILAGALFTTKPAAAMSDTARAQAQQVLHVETGACVDPGAAEGTIGVDVTNTAAIEQTFTVTVNGEQKDIVVAAGQTEYIAFTELVAGTYTVELTTPDGTVYTDSANIVECHERELPIVTIETSKCVAMDDCSGSLSLSITNPNDYDVTYTVRVGHFKKDVFVAAKDTQSIMFNHLSAGDYSITVNGDDCTELCLEAIIEQCPEEEPQPEQPGQGSGTPTPAQPATPATPAQVTPAAIQPAILPDTSAQSSPSAIVATQPNRTAPAASLLILSTGVALLAYAGVRRVRG